MSLATLLSATVNSYAPPAPIVGSAGIVVQSGYDGTTAQINYTAPTYNSSLVPTITSFTAYAVENPSLTATVSTSASGTINVTGLSIGTTYTFKVYATNANGRSPDSDPSNAVTSTSVSQNLFTTAGTSTFTVPSGTTSISILLIGGGGAGGIAYGSGGGGGALTYLNNYAVTPGQTFNLNIGDGGNNTSTGGKTTWFGNSTLLFAGGGAAGADGVTPYINSGGGGGGAGGYAAAGGDGGSTNSDGSLPGSATPYANGGVGGGSLAGRVTYGGGRGGRGWLATSCSFAAAPAVTGGAGAGGSGGRQVSAGGGGVGVYGQSSVDSLGVTTTPGPAISNGGSRVITSNGGSGGASYSAARDVQPAQYLYGGGGSGNNGRSWGARGAIRIVYPGDQRQFPSTKVSNF